MGFHLKFKLVVNEESLTLQELQHHLHTLQLQYLQLQESLRYVQLFWVMDNELNMLYFCV